MSYLNLNPTKLTVSNALYIEPKEFYQPGPTFKKILFNLKQFFQVISIHSFFLTMYLAIT